MAGKAAFLLLACAGAFAVPGAALAQSAQVRSLDRAVELNLAQAMERLLVQRKAIASQRASVQATNAEMKFARVRPAPKAK